MATPIKVSVNLDTTQFNAGVAGMTQQLKTFKAQGVEGAFTALKALKGGLIGTAVFMGFRMLSDELGKTVELFKQFDKANIGGSLGINEMAKAQKVAQALHMELNEVVKIWQKFQSGESLSDKESGVARAMQLWDPNDKQNTKRVESLVESGEILSQVDQAYEAAKSKMFAKFFKNPLSSGSILGAGHLAMAVVEFAEELSSQKQGTGAIKGALSESRNKSAWEGFVKATEGSMRSRLDTSNFNELKRLTPDEREIVSYTNKIADLEVELQKLKRVEAEVKRDFLNAFSQGLEVGEDFEKMFDEYRMAVIRDPLSNRSTDNAVLISNTMNRLTEARNKQLTVSEKMQDIQEKLDKIEQDRLDKQWEAEEAQTKQSNALMSTSAKLDIARKGAGGWADEMDRLKFTLEKQQALLMNTKGSWKSLTPERIQEAAGMEMDILGTKEEMAKITRQKSEDTIKSFFGRGMDFQVNDQQQHGGWGAGQQGVISNVNNAIIQQAKDIGELLQLVKRNAGGGIIQ